MPGVQARSGLGPWAGGQSSQDDHAWITSLQFTPYVSHLAQHCPTQCFGNQVPRGLHVGSHIHDENCQVLRMHSQASGTMHPHPWIRRWWTDFLWRQDVAHVPLPSMSYQLRNTAKGVVLASLCDKVMQGAARSMTCLVMGA